MVNFFIYLKKFNRNRYLFFVDKGRIFVIFMIFRIGKFCVFCKGEYYFNYCNDFLVMDVENRKKYVKENNLCFGCLNVGYIFKYCEWRLKCRICGRNYFIFFYGDICKVELIENLRDKKLENFVYEL